jgi:hypothetical protein
MQHSSNLVLGELTLPFEERNGVDKAERRNFNFRFSYRQIPFSAHFRADDETSKLDVEGDIGPMPFSAESALARIELQTVLDAANAHLGEVFQVHDGRIRIVGAMPVTPPVTAVGLVTAITLFLLKRRPYLETIEVFLLPPGEAKQSGESLRPGWRRTNVKHHRPR